MAERVTAAERAEAVAPGKAILGGFIGTILITIVLYAGGSDLARMLGTMFTPDPVRAFWLGMLIHFFIGSIVLSLIYAYVFYHALPGGPWTKGIIYGILVWIVAMAVVMPMMGVVHPMVKRGQMPNPGFFMAYMGAMPAIVSLIGHIIYGAFLGGIYGRR